MNLVQTLISLDDLCNNSLISVAVSAVKTVFTIIQFGVPAVLIILCAIDMFKAMTNGDEKEVSKAKKTCIHRLIYALVIFLIVPILQIIMTAINQVIDFDGTDDAANTFTAFFKCWNQNGGGSGSSSSNEKGVCRDYNNNIVNLPRSECSDNYYWDNNG